MPRKCSIANCNSNYDNTDEKIPVYGFPLKNKNELQLWLSVLPNIIEENSVTRYMGICARHWPTNASFKSCFGKQVPAEPPSVFPNCPDTFRRQTVSTCSRTLNRSVTSEQRSSLPDEMEEFERMDKIPPNFEEFYLALLSKNFGVHVIKDTSIYLLTFDKTYRQIETSIQISPDLSILAWRQNTQVPVQHLLGFQWKLQRWSQLQNIICRVRNFPLSVTSEVKSTTHRLKLCLESSDSDSSNFTFLLKQLNLRATEKCGRRYDANTMIIALKLYICSRSCYKELREHMCLPHPSTLQQNIGGLDSVCSEEESTRVSSLFFEKHSGISRNCMVLFDEIYIKPSLRYRAGHVIGFSADRPSEKAKTILVFMVKSVFAKAQFVIRFVPLYTISAEIIKENIHRVIRMVEMAKGRTVGIMSDNHSSNRSLHTMLRVGTSTSDLFKIVHPISPSRDMYLLFDSVHLLKCIRNNWVSEKMQQLEFNPPGKIQSVVAKWSDLVDLYNSEKDHTVKRTTITHRALHPSSFEKQKVSLVLQIFNEKTVAALVQDGKSDTACFVDHILRMWKILNNKSTTAHIHLNDPDRKTITSEKDPQLEFLSLMSMAFKQQTPQRPRIKTLTRETTKSLSQTLDGLVELSKVLLRDTAVQFILLGRFQSDTIEGEFGIYRGMFGGLYHISMEQVLIAAKFRRIQLFQKLEIHQDMLEEHPLHSSQCCTSDFAEEEWEAIDISPAKVNDISEVERNTIFYICGYISYKDDLPSNSDTSSSISTDPQDSEFTYLVSRGKLRYPTKDLFHFALIAYALFNSMPNCTCKRRLVRAFEILHDSLFFNQQQVSSVISRLVNTFFTGLVKRMNDNSANPGENVRKKIKLSG